jgi:beta-lactamase superfamily II metal-dependent hydrolase
MKLQVRKLVCAVMVVASAGWMASAMAAQSEPVVNKPTTTKTEKTDKLRVYFIDVEGGQSTLFVTPAGQSLLIDTGWPGNDDRDANRIVAAVKKAGISKIDYVLLTHYHEDHAGGIPQLLAKIPVETFIDHGPNRELDKGITEKDYADYQKALATGKYKNIHAKPGDVLPIKGMTATVISSDGNLIDKPLPGGGEFNQYCKVSETRPADQTENSRSLGIEINFGKLKLLDLGDLTWDKEMQLMCPNNRLGRIDILIVSHHGWNQSSSPALVDAIHARVAIMDNGAKKGGSTPVLQTFKAAPGLETLWQLHYSEEGGLANNTTNEYIANPHGPDGGHGIDLVADPDGAFDVINMRTGLRRHYRAK